LSHELPEIKERLLISYNNRNPSPSCILFQQHVASFSIFYNSVHNPRDDDDAPPKDVLDTVIDELYLMIDELVTESPLRIETPEDILLYLMIRELVSPSLRDFLPLQVSFCQRIARLLFNSFNFPAFAETMQSNVNIDMQVQEEQVNNLTTIVWYYLGYSTTALPNALPIPVGGFRKNNSKRSNSRRRRSNSRRTRRRRIRQKK
jgi:hypothetical protein